MEFKLDKTDEGYVLTVGSTKWVYGRLKQALKKVEALVIAAATQEPEAGVAAAAAVTAKAKA